MVDFAILFDMMVILSLKFQQQFGVLSFLIIIKYKIDELRIMSAISDIIVSAT